MSSLSDVSVQYALHLHLARSCPYSLRIRSLLSPDETPPTEIYPLSLHDALPISVRSFYEFLLREGRSDGAGASSAPAAGRRPRSEEHTSELQSRVDLVCRLLLEKKKIKQQLRQLLRLKHTLVQYQQVMQRECALA